MCAVRPLLVDAGIFSFGQLATPPGDRPTQQNSSFRKAVRKRMLKGTVAKKALQTQVAVLAFVIIYFFRMNLQKETMLGNNYIKNILHFVNE